MIYKFHAGFEWKILYFFALATPSTQSRFLVRHITLAILFLIMDMNIIISKCVESCANIKINLVNKWKKLFNIKKYFFSLVHKIQGQQTHRKKNCPENNLQKKTGKRCCFRISHCVYMGVVHVVNIILQQTNTCTHVEMILTLASCSYL